MKTIAIHQPNFMPWLGYFYKMAHADIFVLLDDVLHSKGSYTNRVKIKSPNGVKRLTVPLSQKEIAIKDLPVANHEKWQSKQIRLIHDSYSKAACFGEYYCYLEDIYSRTWDYLVDLNIAIIHFLKESLNIDTKLVRSSELHVDDRDKNTRNLSLCKALDGDIYLSGDGGGRQYNLEDLFHKENMEVQYANFKHPVYEQLWGDFEYGLSAIDLILNHGQESRNILTDSE